MSELVGPGSLRVSSRLFLTSSWTSDAEFLRELSASPTDCAILGSCFGPKRRRATPRMMTQVRGLVAPITNLLYPVAKHYYLSILQVPQPKSTKLSTMGNTR